MSIAENIHERPHPPRGRRDNRAAILLAGRILFARHGVAGVTFEHIAREAGLTRRTIYNHFANVDDLFAASIQDMLQQVKACMPAAPQAKQPLRPALGRMAHDLLGLFTSACFTDLHLALVRHGADRPALRRIFERQLLDPLHAALAGYLRARHAQDFVGDPRRIAQEIVVLMLGLAETSRLLGRSGEEAMRHGVPLAVTIVDTLVRPRQVLLDRVA